MCDSNFGLLTLVVALSTFVLAKVVALNLFASFLYRFCKLVLWLLLYVAYNKAIALPTIARAIVVPLLALKNDSEKQYKTFCSP